MVSLEDQVWVVAGNSKPDEIGRDRMRVMENSGSMGWASSRFAALCHPAARLRHRLPAECAGSSGAGRTWSSCRSRPPARSARRPSPGGGSRPPRSASPIMPWSRVSSVACSTALSASDQVRRALPVTRGGQVGLGNVEPAGHPPVLGPFIDRAGPPADPHDDQFAQSRIELVAAKEQGGEGRGQLLRDAGCRSKTRKTLSGAICSDTPATLAAAFAWSRLRRSTLAPLAAIAFNPLSGDGVQPAAGSSACLPLIAHAITDMS